MVQDIGWLHAMLIVTLVMLPLVCATLTLTFGGYDMFYSDGSIGRQLLPSSFRSFSKI